MQFNYLTAETLAKKSKYILPHSVVDYLYGCVYRMQVPKLNALASDAPVPTDK
jgi:hypothetical protein